VREMEKVEISLKKYNRYDINKNLKCAYATALKSERFKSLVTNLKIKDNIAYKYTSKLERTVCELSNCEDCRGLAFCKNPMEGFVYYPKLIDGKLEFSYIACKYKKEYLKKANKTIYYELPYEMQIASMKNIDLTDKRRAKVIKWLKEFYDNYELNRKLKGLYLHGSFGSGKSYILSALINELAKDNVYANIVYYPNLLRKLKESFNDNSYESELEGIMNCDILLLDDLGAENNTPWSRDEILGTILQYRMDNDLSTFITSNLNLEELETHLKATKDSTDKVKARRIIERIKQLTEDIELISENRR